MLKKPRHELIFFKFWLRIFFKYSKILKMNGDSVSKEVSETMDLELDRQAKIIGKNGIGFVLDKV